MLSKLVRAPLILSLLAASFAASADYHVDMLKPNAPMANDAYSLHWGILWVCVAIFIIVFSAMFWSVFKHRRSQGAVPAQFHENTTIEIIWTLVPLIVLVAMAWPATRTMLEMKDASNADIAVKVTAYQWRWEYDYQKEGLKLVSNLSTPRDQIDERDGPGKPKNEHYLLEVDNPMVVPVGKKVRLLITSNDVIHGWYVPQLAVNQYGIPGFIKDAWFTAEQPGIYRGQCSQICGKEHAYMPIVVDVRSEADYNKWVQEQKAKQPPPTPTNVPQQAPAATSETAPQQVAAANAAGAGQAVGGGVGAQQAGKAAQGGAAAPAKMDVAELKANGEKLYAANCAACHQPTGKGMPPAFPALAGSKVATGAKPGHIAVVLNGRPGTAMASFARLTDAEIASIITFERTSWGNNAGEVQPAEVAAARK
jgi:cytochrome c oxidase subunit 2